MRRTFQVSGGESFGFTNSRVDNLGRGPPNDERFVLATYRFKPEAPNKVSLRKSLPRIHCAHYGSQSVFQCAFRCGFEVDYRKDARRMRGANEEWASAHTHILCPRCHRIKRNCLRISEAAPKELSLHENGIFPRATQKFIIQRYHHVPLSLQNNSTFSSNTKKRSNPHPITKVWWSSRRFSRG